MSSNLALPLFTKKLQCFSEIHASPNDFSSGTDSLINCQTFFSDCPTGFLKVLPLVFIFVGCDCSFFSLSKCISFLIKSLFFLNPLNDALKKIRSSDNPLSLYLKFISLEGMYYLSVIQCLIEIKISLNSLLKQPAFILIPPPIVPGIHDKNSKPPKLFSIANSDNDLSVTALPAIIISSFNNEILLKLLVSLMTTPLNCLSVINVFEPAPNTNIFSLF